MSKNKLSVYLIKSAIDKVEDIFEDGLDVLEKYSEDKCAYYVPSSVHSPKWLNSFFGLDPKNLLQSNARAILLVNRSYGAERRIFAISFGYAKSLFKDDVLEEQFGLRVLLNSIDENELRKISKINVGGNQKQSQEQIPKSGSISEFGFDIDRDLVRSVTAKSKEDIFNKGVISGGDIFSVSVDRDVNDIESFLDACYVKYQNNDYKEKFDWVDKIREVRSKGKKEKLDNALIERINCRQFDSVWMAVPEVISWESVKSFRYDGCKLDFDDIYIEKIVALYPEACVSTIEQLKSKKVSAKSSLDEDFDLYKWTAYKCLIAEIDMEGESYCINSGKWYKIDNNFANTVNEEFGRIELSDLVFLPYDAKGRDQYDENIYNEDLAHSIIGAELIHKVGEIPYGGGQGNKIEVCDVMTLDKRLIHIKRNSGSSQLSHLFNQAAVSAEALQDARFREKCNKKMREVGCVLHLDNDFHSNNYTVVIGIVNKFMDERPKIPFFSRVAIRYTYRAINSMGYKIHLKNIPNISSD